MSRRNSTRYPATSLPTANLAGWNTGWIKPWGMADEGRFPGRWRRHRAAGGIARVLRVRGAARHSLDPGGAPAE